MEYRFEKEKGTKWSSFERQKERYETIKHLLGEDAVGAELGVYKGGFGEFLRAHCKRLYLVDPWYRKSLYWGDKDNDNDSTVTAFYNIVTIYLEEMQNGKVLPIPDFSVSFLKSLPDDHLDWVYIDSSHTYKNTKKELQHSMRKVRPGGYIVGDDHSKEGVAAAVSELCQECKIRLCLKENNQWGIQVPS